MQLIFIRHTSVDVPKGVCYGQSDVPVSSSFSEEARSVANALKSYSFDKVYSSPLSRCRKLAQACGFGNPIVDSRLLEMNFGEWEMLPWDKIIDPRLEHWYADFLHFKVPGGESFEEQGLRLKSFLDDLSACKADTIAIFTHGGIIMHALMLLGDIPSSQIFSHQPPYSSITALTC